MSAPRKCPTCGSEHLKPAKGHHHFVESGLGNVHLLNVEMLLCEDCDEKIVSLPNSTQLMRCIAEEIIASPNPLSGPEIRFLRKNLHLKIYDFAKLLGVDRVSVSRWENEQAPPSKPNDRLIRLLYVARAKVTENTVERLLKHLEADENIHRQREYVIPLPIEELACVAADRIRQTGENEFYL